MKTIHKEFSASGWPLEIATTMLVKGGGYVFEQRPDGPSIGAAGTIAAVGGKIEWGELAEEAALRETNEETNLRLQPGQLRSLGMVSVKSDLNGEIIDVNAHAYEVQLPANTVVSTRGKCGGAVSLCHHELRERLDEFSPATKKIVEDIYLKHYDSD